MDKGRIFIFVTKPKETCAHEKKTFILVFRHEESLVVDDPLYLNFFCQTDPVRAKTPIFNRYSLVAPQP